MELLCKLNPLTAYLFDACVTHFGLTITNTLQETYKVQVGKHTEHKSRYRLEQLLDPRFKLPRAGPEKATSEANPWQPFIDLVGKPRTGVKAYRYVGPEPKQAS